LFYFLSFLKFFERKNGLGIEKIKLTAVKALRRIKAIKKKCYLPRAPFGEVKCRRIRLLTAEQFSLR
jgi:hypothetical protein